MSKISERLTKLGQTERSGFGFAAKAASTKIPVILVGVTVTDSAAAKGIEADLFVLSPDSTGAPQATPIEGADIWGAAVSGGTSKDIDATVESGADFVLVEGESAPGSALRDDETSKGFVVENDVSENRTKAINSSPFDFLILNGNDLTLPLNVGSVLDVQEELAKYSQHIFLSVSEIPDQENLELLRDIGISALIYDGKTTVSADLASLRKTIEQLEPKKQKSNAGATLPRSGESFAPEEDHEDHDHSDDDDDWE